MNLLRFALLGCLVLGLAGCGHSSNEETIVGTWEMTKTDGEEPAIPVSMEFTRDGKATTTMMGSAYESAYAVEGDKLTMTEKNAAGKEEKHILTITKLTDKELETKGSDGKVNIFKRK